MVVQCCGESFLRIRTLLSKIVNSHFSLRRIFRLLWSHLKTPNHTVQLFQIKKWDNRLPGCAPGQVMWPVLQSHSPEVIFVGWERGMRAREITAPKTASTISLKNWGVLFFPGHLAGMQNFPSDRTPKLLRAVLNNLEHEILGKIHSCQFMPYKHTPKAPRSFWVENTILKGNCCSLLNNPPCCRNHGRTSYCSVN